MSKLKTKEEFVELLFADSRLYGTKPAVSLFDFKDLCFLVYPDFDSTKILKRLIHLELIETDKTGYILFKVKKNS